MEERVFKKLFRSGGKLDIQDAFTLMQTPLPNMTKKEVFDKLLKDNGKARHIQASGSNISKP